ncbi:hypothetical protein GCM10010520_19610 [Rhizobium viscosum]|uniref:Uncharacterized protein n=1 Tax=Rhizobium viscosum TaxID=1673 RepID=A0ABR9IWM3_RHIVS|nr:hypothetical protein [Rhizobium viscosum]
MQNYYDNVPGVVNRRWKGIAAARLGTRLLGDEQRFFEAQSLTPQELPCRIWDTFTFRAARCGIWLIRSNDIVAIISPPKTR